MRVVGLFKWVVVGLFLKGGGGVGGGFNGRFAWAFAEASESEA
jgi:hypothetical protein